jgi:Protein of unknown function (DUF1189)
MISFKFNTIPSTIAGSMTNFAFYRELILRPVKESFIYLAIMVLIPVLLFTGIQVYELNELMTRITDSLKGNLPALRIENGEIIMDGVESDTFRFETENEFSVSDWLIITDYFGGRHDRETAQAIRKEEDGKPLSAKDEELISEFNLATNITEEAKDWIQINFPDQDIIITSAEADKLLASSPPASPDTAQLLKETGHFNNFVFLVDLTTENPQLPPGIMGFALSKNSYTINTPLMPKKIEFEKDLSTVINDDILTSWRKSFIFQVVPIIALFIFLISYVIILLIILGGSALAGLTASFLKKPLPFRQVFALAVYAITPSIAFVLLTLVLLLLKISIGYTLIIFLVLYAVYLIAAARKCASDSAFGAIVEK